MVAARNLTEASRLNERLWVQRLKAGAAPQVFDISNRRVRIAAIQNEVKEYLGGCDFIFGVEDDTIPSPHAFRQLQHDYVIHPHAGFIEGVELSRSGVPHVGAWRADDVYEPTKFETAMPPERRTTENVEEIDAGAFYSDLTKAQTFLAHHYAPYGEALGPDVAYGLALRQQGFQNYINCSVRCAHYTADGTPVNAEPVQVRLVHRDERWCQEAWT
jgi:hypothetical protein